MLLARVAKLWGEDADAFWPYLRYFVTPPTLLMTRSAGYGLERVPATGGAVIAANHFSGIDHPLIGSYCPRAIHFLAKAELIEMPIVGDLIAWTGTISVRRGEGDRDALRKAREVVRRGSLVGVHVEGTRQRFGHPGEVKTGGLMIALQEDVPVIPCGVDTFGWSPVNRRRCAVVWGEPLKLEGIPRRKAGYAHAAELVGAEIVRLWRQAAEAVAAGLPAALPDGTRREAAVFAHRKRNVSTRADDKRRLAGVSH